jgi:hypothetical protein
MSRYLVLVFRVGVSLGFAFWACAKILFGYSEGMALSRAAFYGAAIFESVVALLVSGERYLLGCRLAAWFCSGAMLFAVLGPPANCGCAGGITWAEKPLVRFLSAALLGAMAAAVVITGARSLRLRPSGSGSGSQ